VETITAPVVCQDGEARAPRGPRLFTRLYQPADTPRGEVLLLHGYDDHSGRYEEAATALAAAGYRVRSFDFRGHGRSGGLRGYCRRWEEYLDDLAAVLAARPAEESAAPLLIAQSHGALVAAHWALRHPASVAGLALLSPYLRLVMPVPRLKLAAAGTLNRVAPCLPLKSEIRVEMLTRDEERQRETRADRLIRRVATPRWFCTSTAAQAELFRRASEITVPTLIVHGADDPIADPSAARELHERLGSADKTLRVYDGMRHETLREIGKEKVLSDLIAWMDAHVR
jgi:alpha-beta hydrolase superfamily lysophospholipase